MLITKTPEESNNTIKVKESRIYGETEEASEILPQEKTAKRYLISFS